MNVGRFVEENSHDTMTEDIAEKNKAGLLRRKSLIVGELKIVKTKGRKLSECGQQPII